MPKAQGSAAAACLARYGIYLSLGFLICRMGKHSLHCTETESVDERKESGA